MGLPSLPSSGLVFPQGTPKPKSHPREDRVRWVIQPTARRGILRPRFGGGLLSQAAQRAVICPGQKSWNRPHLWGSVRDEWHLLWEADCLGAFSEPLSPTFLQAPLSHWKCSAPALGRRNRRPGLWEGNAWV